MGFLGMDYPAIHRSLWPVFDLSAVFPVCQRLSGCGNGKLVDAEFRALL